MTEVEQVRDALVRDLHELKRALYPAASPEIVELISALTDQPSRGLRTASGDWLPGQAWLDLPEDRKLRELSLLQTKVREKIDRISESRAENEKRLQPIKWIVVVGFVLLAIAAAAWVLV